VSSQDQPSRSGAERALRRPWYLDFSRPAGFGVRLIGQLTIFLGIIRQHLRELRVFLRFPLRQKFSPSAMRERTLVLLYGIPYADWNAALAEASLWQEIPGVAEVIRIPAFLLASTIIARRFKGRAVVIPAKIEHGYRLPEGCESLSPDMRSIDLLENKGRFAAYMRGHGLLDLCPATYANAAEASYPCVLKRADRSSSWGVAVVRSEAEVEGLLRSPMFSGRQVVLQALVAGVVEYATYCVCKNGNILWHCTFVTEVDRPETVKSEDNVLQRRIAPTPARVLEQIQRTLAPLAYSGPCNLDYKLDADGDMRILEINPRLGGSLMLPEYSTELRQALGCIVANAA
jgi:hypothetical protein